MSDPQPISEAIRLDEIAEELEQMAYGYLEKGAQLHRDAGRIRANAAAIRKLANATDSPRPTIEEAAGE